MGKPKQINVITVAPAHRAEAITEWQTGVENLIELANRARTGETSLPTAIVADAIVTAISKGQFNFEAESLLSGRLSRLTTFAITFATAIGTSERAPTVTVGCSRRISVGSCVGGPTA